MYVQMVVVAVFVQCFVDHVIGQEHVQCLMNQIVFFNLFCLGPVAIRNIVREGYGIDGTCIGDVLSTCFCPCCTGIQLRSEVNKRGPVTKQNGLYVRQNSV
eukprot:462012_1